MELWDLYDENRIPLGAPIPGGSLCRRGPITWR